MSTVIGVDLGGTNIVGAVMKDGEIVEERKVPTEASKGAEHVLDNIASVVKELLKVYPEIRKVGVGTPGAVAEDGTISGAYNIKGFHGTNLYDGLKNRLNQDFTIIGGNDVDVAALGEYKFGSLPISKAMICVALGTGIGGGLIINGSIFYGASGNALEVGHMVIKNNGRDCTCGRKGCFETYGSATGIKRTFDEMLTPEAKSKLLDDKKIDEVTTKDIYDYAKDGDKFCLEVTEQVTKDLAVGIGNLVNIFNPDLIVIGGGVSLAGDFFFEPLSKALKDQCFAKSYNTVKVVPSNLQDKAGIYGACALAL